MSRDTMDVANLPILVRCRCNQCGFNRWWAPQMLRWGIKHNENNCTGTFEQIPEDDPK